jgi:hypothetical protein
MILSQAYKNDEESIQRYTSRLDEMEKDISCPFFNNDFDGTIHIYGSGGSPMLQGCYCPNPLTNSKDDPMIMFPMCQNMDNPLNKALTDMCYNKKVVTIYLNEALFNETHTNQSSDTMQAKRNNDQWCRCLGFFYANSATVEEDSDDERTNCLIRGFKNVPHLRVSFTPLLSNEDMNLLMSGAEQTKKQNLIIPYGCKDTIDVTDAVEVIKTITRKSVLERYIRARAFLKYIDPKAAYKQNNQTKDKAKALPDSSPETPKVKRARLIHCDDDVEDYFSVSSLSTVDSESQTYKLPSNKVVKDNITIQSKAAGIGVTLEELSHSMVLCSAAGAIRFQKRCLLQVGGEFLAGPLPSGNGLPFVFRIHPMPMPNRALDLLTICLRQESVSCGVYERCESQSSSRIKYQHRFFDDLTVTTFKAILLRYTGRINAYSLYALDGQKKCFLPDREEIKQFLAYVRTTINPKLGNAKMRGWVSEQHSTSIPNGLKEYNNFARFLNLVGLRLPVCIERMLDKTVNGERSQAIILLKVMLEGCNDGDDSGNVGFLAQQVVADVEEIFVDPFGTVTSQGIILGNGSQHGFSMMKNRRVDQHDMFTPDEALKLIIEYMEDYLCDEYIEMLGYRRNKKTDSKVVNKVNGRPISATDAEHFLCKAWVIAKYTLPNNTMAERSKSTQPHCHPANIRGQKFRQLQNIADIMDCIVTMKDTLPSQINCPEFCKMPNEVSEVPREIVEL